MYNANLPKITQYYTELSQDERLYAKFKAIRASAGFAALGVERRKIIDNELRDFRLGGAELPPEEKARFKAMRERLDSSLPASTTTCWTPPTPSPIGRHRQSRAHRSPR